ncbi:hypothetical protein GIB67_033394 [Kingdonia uniflora]|uniref:Uncharacterized protein n=1 Tax=Kingdonia uniflora TaxID=39325 RepID=A0A7J7LTQ8_9MAGN|nr:hypothetical protein GIB67_033394 [Kingdonia uniflora]
MAAILHCSITPNLPSSVHSSLTTYKPMHKEQSYWASINSDIETHLKMSIPIRSPLSVYEPMHHLTLSAPRSMAPALCIAACEVVGGHGHQAIDAAAAVHLMQTAAYTHENLILLDQQKPNLAAHHSYDTNIQLLMGDTILPFAYELLASSDDSTGNNSHKILRVIIELSQAMGTQGMIDGQYKKMQRIGSDDRLIYQVCKKMEGELYSCGAACGAILGGGSDNEIKKLRRYGLYVGLIHGMMLRGIGLGRVKEIKALALKELHYFKNQNIEAITSLVDARLFRSSS